MKTETKHTPNYSVAADMDLIRVIKQLNDLLEILAPFIEIWAKGGSDYADKMRQYWCYENLSKARAAIARAEKGE